MDVWLSWRILNILPTIEIDQTYIDFIRCSLNCSLVDSSDGVDHSVAIRSVETD